MEEYYAGFWEVIGTWISDVGAGILVTILVAIVAWWITGPVVNWVRVKVSRKSKKKLPRSEIRKRHKTVGDLIILLVHVLIVVMALFSIFTRLGLDLTPMIASAGIVGIALGFGTQSLVRDTLTGFFIIAESQYRVGDYIQMSGLGIREAIGTVEKISLRTTKVRDREGNVHFVPNGSIVHVMNQTMGYGKIHFEFDVKANTDLDKLAKIVNKAGEELAKDPAWKDKILDPPHFVEMTNFGASAIEVVVSGKTTPADQWLATSEYKKRLLEALNKAKIKIN